MKILYLVNAYPCKEKPHYGIFIKEQYEYISKNFNVEMKLFELKGKNSFHKYFQPLKVLKAIKDYNPDIIHIHYGLSGIPIILIYPFILKRKIISTFHGSDINGSFFVNLLSNILAFISNKNIAVSKEIYDKLFSYKKNKIHIPCGVDPMFFLEDNKKEIINQIIFPGNPNRVVKNYKLFEEVLLILKNKYKENPNVIIFDSKSRQEVKDALLTSKCLVLTSLSEGSPQVVKEAIVCNLPVVSTPVGDVPFLISNLPNCYISESAESLAKNIKSIFDSKKVPFSNLIKHNLSNEYICNNIIDLYKSCINIK